MTATHGAPAEIAALLDAAIPLTATPVLAPGFAALAWATGVDDLGATYVEVVYALGGRAAAALVQGVEPGDVGPADVARARSVGAPLGRPAWTLPAGPPPGRRAEALEAIAAGCDADVLRAMAGARLRGVEVHDWMAGAGPDRDAVLAFVRAHPWLAAAAAGMATAGTGTAGWAPAPFPADPDEAAARVLASLGAGARAGEIAGRMRGFVLPDDLAALDDPECGDAVAALAGLPGQAFPEPLRGGEPADGPEQQGYLALIALAPHLVRLSALSGRPVGSLLGRVGGWGDYAVRLAGRAGLGEGPGGYPGQWGWILAEDAVGCVSNMVERFASEVLAPAARIAFPGEAPRVAPRSRIRDIFPGSVEEAAARLLLGARTLPALAEVSARWHARSDAIARLLVDAAGEAAPRGPRLFEDLDIDDRHYVTCLHTARQLVDEGAPGPDAAGVSGLDHCVGGYGEAVASGRVAIVALRRRVPGGFLRVSTAEVDFSAARRGRPPHVEQHRAWRNTEPGETADALLAAALARLAAPAHARLAAYLAEGHGPFDWSQAIARGGTWEGVRDAYAFALPRPLRQATPAQILDAAGYRPAVHAA